MKQQLKFSNVPAAAVKKMATSLYKIVKKYDEEAVFVAAKFSNSFYTEGWAVINGHSIDYAIRVSDHAKPGYDIENLIYIQEKDSIEIEVFDAEGAEQARKALVEFFESLV